MLFDEHSPTQYELAAWPAGIFVPAAELLTWLHRHRPQLLQLEPAVSGRMLATLHWLVLAEADRSAPERGPPATAAAAGNHPENG